MINNFVCDNYFSKLKDQCETMKDPWTKVSTEVPTSQFSEKTFSVTIKKGYNLITKTDFGNVTIERGYMIKLTHKGGKVAVDRTSMNKNPMSDFWIDGSYKSRETEDNGGKLTINKKNDYHYY